ncbi:MULTISPECIES: nitrilase-related carbon-nitrogen hydrolase [Subtercola]|uniref:Nitrilase n=1 Tax=Subtercola vilae TaxID=2056433 RepID=A0A4T2C2Q6_9MICO|nr:MULTISPECIES: nitrilase-related carbon-nitrogen hydrolase [Subtercola]MEA9984207.1 nitrilase-related carbon-nitrogen hydrolase [Subtercola sp. RTI3]TIH37411.1 nitrilase [Subtercola vilae]
MRLAVFQGQAIALDFPHNLALLEAAAIEAAEGRADILITPELFAVGYAPDAIAREVTADDVDVIERSLCDMARRHRIALVFSTPGRGDATLRGITSTFVDSEGVRLGTYTKSHLFGEHEAAAFQPGLLPPTVVSFAGVRVGLAICFDVEFPEVARAAAVRGADILLVPTAVGEGFESVSLVLVPARALENSMVIAYANHAGVENGFAFSGTSVIVDSDGTIVAQAGKAPSVMFADVEARRPEVDYLTELKPELYASWSALPR